MATLGEVAASEHVSFPTVIESVLSATIEPSCTTTLKPPSSTCGVPILASTPLVQPMPTWSPTLKAERLGELVPMVQVRPSTVIDVELSAEIVPSRVVRSS